MKYDPSPVPANRDDIYRMAYQSVAEELLIEEKLIPYTTGAVIQLPEFPNQKSPGLPWKQMGYRTKIDVVKEQKNIAAMNATWHQVSARKRVELPDVCLFARAQVAKTGVNKIRATWGYPLEVYLEEARFFYPIQDYMKSHFHKFNIAYGAEMANGGMSIINEMLTRTKGKYLITDWSRFDKTIPSWFIRDAFSLLAQIVDFTKVRYAEGKVWNVRAERSKRRWKKLIDYFGHPLYSRDP